MCVFVYSIPLNKGSQLRPCRIFHRRRMNMLETNLESSRLGGSENIYIAEVILNIFWWNYENVNFLEIKDLKMAWIWTPIWTSKKACFENARGHFMVSLSKRNPSRHMSCQWDLFLMTRAFEWWLLDCHTTSQKFSAAWNPKFCDLDKKSRGDFKIQLIWKEWSLHQAEVINVLKIEMFRWFIDLLSP